MDSIKIIGMVHIPGVNDERYAEYISSLGEPDTVQVMISVVENRW